MDRIVIFFTSDLEFVVALDSPCQFAPGQVPELGEGIVKPFHIIRQTSEKLGPAQGSAPVCIQGIIGMLEMGVDTVKVQLTHSRCTHVFIQHIAGNDTRRLNHSILCDCKILGIGDIVVVRKVKTGDRPNLREVLSQKGSALL